VKHKIDIFKVYCFRQHIPQEAAKGIRSVNYAIIESEHVIILAGKTVNFAWPGHRRVGGGPLHLPSRERFHLSLVRVCPEHLVIVQLW
jgi:hypothetical protein